MPDKIIIEVEATIERLEREIQQLEDELRQKNVDLRRHKKILKLATNCGAGATNGHSV